MIHDSHKLFAGTSVTSTTDCLSEASRAELLCQLVAEQLLARATVGRWLMAEPLVACTRAWCRAKGVPPYWQEGLRLGQLSEQLASDLWAIKPLHDLTRVSGLFGHEGLVDYGSPFVRKMHDVCVARLLANGLAKGD